MSPFRRAIAVISLLAISWIGCPVTAHAGGLAEDPLAEARRLLDEGRISEALSRSMDVFMANKDQQDAVLELLDRSLRKNEEFNEALRRFVELDFATPEGIAGGQRILAELRDIDKAPNPEMSIMLSLLESRLAFEQTTRTYAALMEEVLPLVQSGRYYEAVTLYLTGFTTLGRSTFDATDFKTLLAGTPFAAIREETLADVGAVEDAARDAAGRQEALETAERDLYTAVARADAAALSEALGRLLDELDRLDRNRDAMAAAATRLLDRHQALFSQKGIYENYLWFSYLLITGTRTPSPGAAAEASQTREGLFKSLEMQWESVAARVAERVESKALQLVAEGKEGYLAGDYAGSTEKMTAAYSFFVDANRVLRSWGTQFRLGSNLRPTAKGAALIRSITPRMLLRQEQAKEARSLAELAEPIAALERVAAGQVAAGAQDLEQRALEIAQARDATSRERSLVHSVIGEWERIAERYGAILSTPVGSPEAAAGAVATRDLIRAQVARFDQEDLRLAEAQVGIEYTMLRREYDRLAVLAADALARIVGIEVTVATVDPTTGAAVRETRLERSPAAGAAALGAVDTELAALEGGVGAYLGRWQGEARPAIASATLDAELARGRELGAAIATLKADIAARLLDAADSIRLAAEFREKGERAFAQAQAALQAERLDLAGEYVTEAGTAFFESLSYEENAEVRRLRDVDLLAFQARILQAGNALVVRDVRALLTDGKRLFAQADYAGAAEMYQRAQARWYTTNTDPNAEVELALRNVRNALLFRSQREIKEENPLYDVVSQLYNTAFAAYQEGARLIRAGNKPDGLRRFAEAKNTIGNIRRLVPFYQDVRVLALRISQLEDAAKFRTDFGELFREAVAKIGTESLEALSQLQDLRQIDATYRGLDAAIYDASVALGLIRPQPKAADTRTSTNLYNQARAIYLARRTEQFPEALRLLDQALVLWDANGDAIVLKDQIAAQQGGTIQLVLPNTLETRYQEALRLYRSKEYFRAKAIIDQLMRDPVAKIYPPLIELERRVALETG